jgi:hypothetical protein
VEDGQLHANRRQENPDSSKQTTYTTANNINSAYPRNPHTVEFMASVYEGGAAGKRFILSFQEPTTEQLLLCQL